MRQAVSAGWVLPVDGAPLEDAYVAWEAGRIVEIGPGRVLTGLTKRIAPDARSLATAPNVEGGLVDPLAEPESAEPAGAPIAEPSARPT